MTVSDVMMLLVGVIGTASAVALVTSRNVVHSALYLVVALLAVAGTFLVLGAEFLAWAQVLVYVGAVIVLILFGLMLTRAPIGPTEQGNELGNLPIVVAVLLFGFLATVIVVAFGDTGIALTPTPAAAIGEVLYLHWAFPFLVIGFFLTVALIGAIVLARREEGEGPEPPVETRLPDEDADEPAGLSRPAGAPAETDAVPGAGATR